MFNHRFSNYWRLKPIIEGRPRGWSRHPFSYVPALSAQFNLLTIPKNIIKNQRIPANAVVSGISPLDPYQVSSSLVIWISSQLQVKTVTPNRNTHPCASSLQPFTIPFHIYVFPMIFATLLSRITIPSLWSSSVLQRSLLCIYICGTASNNLAIVEPTQYDMNQTVISQEWTEIKSWKDTAS